MSDSARSNSRAPAENDQSRRVAVWHKIRAVLVAGIVLGVGATGTLASFTDSVYGNGTVTSGVFTTDGNTVHPVQGGGSPWSNTYTSAGSTAQFACYQYHNASGGTLAQPLPDSSLNVPLGGSSYCAISVRTNNANNPLVGGKVDLSGDKSTLNTLAAGIKYSVRQIMNPWDGRYCDLWGWNQTSINAAGYMRVIPGYPGDPVPVSLSEGSTTSLAVPLNNDSNYLHFCFQITMPATAPADTSTGVIKWHFTVTPTYT